MAGDYIPWQKGLVRKPEVAQIARALGTDPFATAAHLMTVWEWADEQTEDGTIIGVTAHDIDTIGGTTGLAAAMEAVMPHPWLILSDHAAVFPNFARWNGRCAKRRLKDAIRKREART